MYTPPATQHTYTDKLKLDRIYGVEEICDSIDAFTNFFSKHFPDSIENGTLTTVQTTKVRFLNENSIRDVQVKTVNKFTFNSSYAETAIFFDPYNSKNPIKINYSTPGIHNIEEVWKIYNLSHVANKILDMPSKSKGFTRASDWSIRKELEANYEDVGIKLIKPNGKKKKKEELAKEFFTVMLSFCSKGVFWSSTPLENDLTGLFCKAHFFSKSTVKDVDGYFYNFDSSNPYNFYDNPNFMRGACPYTEIIKSLNKYNIVHKTGAYSSNVQANAIESEVMFYNRYGEKVVNNDFCNMCSFQLRCETNEIKGMTDYNVPKDYLSKFL